MKISALFQDIIILICFGQALGLNSYRYVLEYRSPTSLVFTLGDVISCRIHSSIGSLIYGAEHVMLAVSSDRIVHIHRVRKFLGSYYGKLLEENFIELTEEFEYTACRVATTEYDQIMFPKGFGPRDNEAAVAEARNWIHQRNQRSLYYDLMMCNCQHWVTEWRYGNPWSAQTNQGPNEKCDLHTPAGKFKSGTAYARPLQAGAMAETSMGEERYGGGYIHTTVKLPSAGVYAEAGIEKTGFGFKASLVENRVDVGNVVGVTLGLSADTGVTVGRDEVYVKALGTGFQVSKAKGNSLCLFGSCVHVMG